MECYNECEKSEKKNENLRSSRNSTSERDEYPGETIDFGDFGEKVV